MSPVGQLTFGRVMANGRLLFRVAVLALACLAWWALADGDQAGSFQFVILGDRTGEARPGVYEQAWRELAVQTPAFVVSTGDSIQGGSDPDAEAEWRQWQKIPLP